MCNFMCSPYFIVHNGLTSHQGVFANFDVLYWQHWQHSPAGEVLRSVVHQLFNGKTRFKPGFTLSNMPFSLALSILVIFVDFDKYPL